MVGIAIRQRERESESEDERLLNLFRNRSALKKEFAKLRNEGIQLQKLLERQEGVTLRSQQQLEQLEGMLAHPVQAANASVFYQLRGIWNHCHRKLSRLSENLLAHQRDREMKLVLNQFNAVKKASLDDIDRHEQDVHKEHAEISAKLESFRQQLDVSRGFWNCFNRRGIVTQIEIANKSLAVVTARIGEYLEQKKTKEAESPLDFNGLNIEACRKINLMLIAVAQELYLHFSKHNVSGLAREASARQVSDMNYGDITACREMNIHIEKCLRSLPSGQDLVALARNRVTYLEHCENYRLETDMVPVASSFAEIPIQVGENGDVRGQNTAKINVLADEFWEVYSVLLT